MTITVMTLPFEPCICVKRAHHSITSPLFRYKPIIFYEPIIPLWDHYSRPTLFLYQPKFEVFLRTWVYLFYKPYFEPITNSFWGHFEPILRTFEAHFEPILSSFEPIMSPFWADFEPLNFLLASWLFSQKDFEKARTATKSNS